MFEQRRVFAEWMCTAFYVVLYNTFAEALVWLESSLILCVLLVQLSLFYYAPQIFSIQHLFCLQSMNQWMV